MKRDFSEDARQQLLSLVAQVENEKWCNFTDAIGDRWCDFEAWIGLLNVQDYIDNINDYHKKVIDKNNTNAANIEHIFENVNAVSDCYKSRFIATLANLREYKQIINRLSAVIEPGKGNFTPETINSGLKDAINEYLTLHKSLMSIAGDGLTKEQVDEMEEGNLRRMLDLYAAALLASMPSVDVGEKIEIPVGPGVKVYYSVSGNVKGNSDVSVSMAIEDQKLQLKGFDISHAFGDGKSLSVNSDGEVSSSMTGENGNGVTINMGGLTGPESIGSTVKVTHQDKVGNNTFTYNFAIDPLQKKMWMEEKVTTDMEHGSLSSAVGIEYQKKDEDNLGWQPMPVPIEVEAPYPGHLPQPDWSFPTFPAYEPQWEYVVPATQTVVMTTATAEVLLLLMFMVVLI